MTSEKFRDGGLAGTDSTSETHDEHVRTVPPRRGATDSLIALATAVRWGTTTVGLLWAAALRSRGSDLGLGIVLLGYALWRTYQPVNYRRRGWRSLLSIMVELLITTVIVVSTNCWDSPYIIVLFTPVIAAGFARGFWHALRIGVAAAITVGLAAFILNLDSGIRPATAWCVQFVLVAGIAAYGRHLLTQAEEAGALTLSQKWRLSEANTLLVSLNRLASDSPVTFDLHETVDGAMTRVKEATNPDLVALLLLEPLSSVWSVVMAEGARLPESYVKDALPASVREIAMGSNPKLALDLDASGFSSTSRSAIYVPLWTSNRQVGLLAVESDSRDRFTMTQVSVLKELAETIALTIDNARWFDRLRARGAAQERTRIARDLHDRVGQGVAYVAFELDRLAKKADGTELSDDINQLRSDARSIVSELRETLYDLRTDVSDERGLNVVVSEFLARVSKRSLLEVNFEYNAETRIPLAQEREVWRICQEAVVNVERHADASTVNVSWEVYEGGALLTISDDGVGLHAPHDRADGTNAYADSASPGRPSYGLTGMRERAESIGGVLDISPGEEVGTVVRLALGTRRDTLDRSRATVTANEMRGNA